MLNEDSKHKDIIRKTIDYYNVIAEEYYKQIYSNKDASIPEFLLCLNSFIKRFDEHSRLLDVGCGLGVQADFMNKVKKCRILGIDYSKGMLNFAKKMFKIPWFIQMDVMNLGFKNSCFDGIWAGFILDHIRKKDIHLFIDELYRILKNGGIISILTYHGSNEGVMSGPFKPECQVFFSEWKDGELNEIFLAKGFNVFLLKNIRDEIIHIGVEKV